MKKKKLKIEEVSDEIFDKLEKGHKAFKPAKIKKDEVLYIDYYGEIIPLQEALDRTFKKLKTS